MSAIRRIVSVSVASATVIGLIVPVGYAPPAAAVPCSAPEANVPPPAGMPTIPSPGPVAPPTGRRPRGTNDNAPLPKLGPLISGPAQGHPATAGATPGCGDACSPGPRSGCPAVAERQPGCAGGCSGSAVAASRDCGCADVARRIRDRAQQPEPNSGKVRHLRDRPRHSLGQRRSRQPAGADGVRRHLRLLRSAWPAVAVQRAVPQPGPRPVARHSRGRRRAQQPILRLAGVGARLCPSRCSTAFTRRGTRPESSRRRRSRSGEPST